MAVLFIRSGILILIHRNCNVQKHQLSLNCKRPEILSVCSAWPTSPRAGILIPIDIFVYNRQNDKIDRFEKMGMGRKLNLDAMTVDEMWQLHEEISRVLSVRLISEKRELEERLASASMARKRGRRPDQTEVHPRSLPLVLRSATILAFSPNTVTRKSLPKLGRVVESNRGGWLPRSKLASTH